MFNLATVTEQQLRDALRAKALEGRAKAKEKLVNKLDRRLAVAKSDYLQLLTRIAKLQGRTRPRRPKTGRPRSHNKQPLRVVMVAILKRSGPLTAAKVAERALANGFKTTSTNPNVFKANAANILRLSPEFQKQKDGRYKLQAVKK